MGERGLSTRSRAAARTCQRGVWVKASCCCRQAGGLALLLQTRRLPQGHMRERARRLRQQQAHCDRHRRRGCSLAPAALLQLVTCARACSRAQQAPELRALDARRLHECCAASQLALQLLHWRWRSRARPDPAQIASPPFAR
jgi:hypothetical protein